MTSALALNVSLRRSDKDNAIMHNIGSRKISYSVKPKNTEISEILSNEESRKNPFFELCFVILATEP